MWRLQVRVGKEEIVYQEEYGNDLRNCFTCTVWRALCVALGAVCSLLVFTSLVSILCLQLHLNMCPMVLCATPGPCDQPYEMSTTMWQGRECQGCPYCPSKTEQTRKSLLLIYLSCVVLHCPMNISVENISYLLEILQFSMPQKNLQRYENMHTPNMATHNKR